MQFIIHTDGGARGNPGPSAVGVVIEVCACKEPRSCTEKNRTPFHAFGKRIGEGTNNTAEYTAVIEALTYIRESVKPGDLTGIAFYLDSTLVVNQLNGVFKVKESHLRNLLLSVRSLELEVGGNISYTAVRREQNKLADYYVNQALDAVQ